MSVSTDANGIGAAPTLTANAQLGSYAVNASVSGAPSVAVFNLTNTAGVLGQGSLTGTSSSSSNVVNLTAEGTSDWIHWGDAALNRKAGVSAQLSGFVSPGGAQAIVYNNDPRPISWTDGSPTQASTLNTDGLYIQGIGQGFRFSAPADTSMRTLVVHVGGWFSGGTFSAHLSDGSAADFTDTTAAASGQYDRNYTLVYSTATEVKR